MELIAAFKSELFRPLVTLVLPGGVASAPYLILAACLIPSVRTFGHEYPSTSVAIALACIVGIGLVLEDVGSRIEYRWDKRLNKRHADHLVTWDKYLQLKMRDEIVGQRYLRTLLVRLKFELAMVPAWLAFGIGIIWLNTLTAFWSLDHTLLYVTPFALAAYSAYESYSTSILMGRTRRLILAAMQEHPFDSALGPVAPAAHT